MEEMQSRFQETLDGLSPLELRNFRALLRRVDEEPRVSPLQLELEGGNASGLARLLAKHYQPRAAPRVLIKVLQQLPRVDLVRRWQSDPADGQGERAGGPRGFPGRATGGGGGPGRARALAPPPGDSRARPEGRLRARKSGGKGVRIGARRARALRHRLNLRREVGGRGCAGRMVPICRLCLRVSGGRAAALGWAPITSVAQAPGACFTGGCAVGGV